MHVWCVVVSRLAPHAHILFDVLSIDERKRADRSMFVEDRLRFVVARGVLRLLLGHYSRGRPDRLNFTASHSGRLELANHTGLGQLRFNVSHSGDLALYAVTRERAVGVDIEQMHRLDEVLRVAARFYSPREYLALRTLPAARQRKAFLVCWTRKEAYLKATGQGLDGLAEVEISAKGPTRLLRAAGRSPDELSQWMFHDLRPAPNYVGTVVIETSDRPIGCRLFAGERLHELAQ